MESANTYVDNERHHMIKLRKDTAGNLRRKKSERMWLDTKQSRISNTCEGGTSWMGEPVSTMSVEDMYHGTGRSPLPTT